eukprot:GEMP01002992.1.p1 GENE.GEMP01002992.1~~GEMP01002992.1.p1  ORF type:complete len:1093 (+),score=220.05 GEMP01002992.1:157-3435(+)
MKQVLLDGVLEEEFYLGRKEMDRGNYGKAIGHFTTTLAEKSDVFLMAKNRRGYCYLYMGDEDWALKDFAKVISADAKFNKNVYILAAVCCKRKGDYVTASRYLSSGLSVFPNASELLMARAELWLKLSKYDKAMLDFKKILQKHPDHSTALRGLGDACRGMGNYNEALYRYTEAIEAARAEICDDAYLQERAARVIAGVDHMHEDADVLPPRDVDLLGPMVTPGAYAETRRNSTKKYTSYLQANLCECLYRRTFLMRLLGDLGNAAEDLRDILRLKRSLVAVFWYAKVLVEQSCLGEAASFLRTMNLLGDEKDNNTISMESRALFAAILMQITPLKERDFSTALTLLKKASEKNATKSVLLTKLICQAAEALRGNDPKRALSLLDKIPSGASKKRAVQPPARGEDQVIRQARQVSQKRDLVAKGNDLEVALDCMSYLDFLVHDGDESTLEHELRACANVKLNIWDDALQSCRHAEACSSTAPPPDTLEFNKNIALGMLKQHDLEVAIAHFTKAVLLFPKKSCARLHRAVSLCHLAYNNGKNIENARHFVKDALKDIRALLSDAENCSNNVLITAHYLNAICSYCVRSFSTAWKSYQVVKAVQANYLELDVLGAEILALQGKRADCVKLCNELIVAHSSQLLVCPYTTRAKCLLKDHFEDAVYDLKNAARIAPNSVDVQLQLGDAYFAGGRYREACEAYEECRKTHSTTRVAYSAALINLKMWKISAALSATFECIQLDPSLETVKMTKEGLVCLQDMLIGRFQRAHIKFTSMLNISQQNRLATDELYPSVFSSYEVLLYRGICSLHIDYPQKAVQDFEVAIGSLQQLYETAALHKSELAFRRLPPELRAYDAKMDYEGNLRYNMGVCYLFLEQFNEASDVFTELLTLFGDKPVVLQACLWFLLGLCQLATESVEDSRESFLRSYTLDHRWVDDFLTKHQPPDNCFAAMSPDSLLKPIRSQTPRIGARPTSSVGFGSRPTTAGGFGSRPSTAGISAGWGRRAVSTPRVCHSRGGLSARGPKGPPPLTFSAGKNHLGSRLQGKKLRMRDVVLYIRPACDWPFVCPPDCSPKVDWSMLSHCSHDGIQTEPAFPWA